MEILRELEPRSFVPSGQARLRFPSARANAPNENAILAGMRAWVTRRRDDRSRLSYGVTSRTRLEPSGHRRQLAHAERSGDAAYNFADIYRSGARMMQAWADYLDG